MSDNGVPEKIDRRKHARKLSPSAEARHRENIRTGHVLMRLQAYVLGEKDPITKKHFEMTSQQVKAAEILLSKTLPSLSNLEVTKDEGVNHKAISDKPLDDADWAKKYSLVPDETDPNLMVPLVKVNGGNRDG